MPRANLNVHFRQGEGSPSLINRKSANASTVKSLLTLAFS